MFSGFSFQGPFSEGEKKHYGPLVSYLASTRGSGEACWKPPETPSCDRCLHAWCILLFFCSCARNNDRGGEGGHIPLSLTLWNYRAIPVTHAYIFLFCSLESKPTLTGSLPNTYTHGKKKKKKTKKI